MDLNSNKIVHGWTKLVDPFFYKKISRGKMIKQPSSFYHSYTQLVSNFRRGEISEGIWESRDSGPPQGILFNALRELYPANRI